MVAREGRPEGRVAEARPLHGGVGVRGVALARRGARPRHGALDDGGEIGHGPARAQPEEHERAEARRDDERAPVRQPVDVDLDLDLGEEVVEVRGRRPSKPG